MHELHQNTTSRTLDDARLARELASAQQRAITVSDSNLAQQLAHQSSGSHGALHCAHRQPLRVKDIKDVFHRSDGLMPLLRSCYHRNGGFEVEVRLATMKVRRRTSDKKLNMST